MDILLAEISNKKKDLVTPAGSGSKQKYMRKADIERAREEEARKKKEEEEQKKREEKLAREKEKNDRLAAIRNRSTNASESPAPEAPKAEAFNISAAECIRRLRAKGQPILLFGETEKERRLRLRALELLDERDPKAAGTNEFRRALEEAEKAMEYREIEGRGKGKGKGREEDGDGEEDGHIAKRKKREEPAILDLELVKTEPKKVYPLIYYAIKGWLQDWADYLDDRPDVVKRSVQGRNAAATQVQTAEYLKPLFKTLRQRELEPDVLRLLAEIIHYAQMRSYQRANDAYLRLSIGNAAWPIGVTMVGIHERSAREKIGIDSVAHVLNDEVSRKYIQSVKRLLTFTQTIRPPDDVSQLMG